MAGLYSQIGHKRDMSFARPFKVIMGSQPYFLALGDVVRDIISLNEAHYLLCNHYLAL